MRIPEPPFLTRPLPPFCGALLRRLPLFPLEPPLGALIRLIARADPAFAERLGPYGGRLFAIIATDLGLTFHLRPRLSLRPAPELRLLRGEVREGADAVIAGPLPALVGLALGALDGDALFFSRLLWTEGDTAAILALRNALEEAEPGRLPARLLARLAAGLPFPPPPAPAGPWADRPARAEPGRWN